MANKENAPVNKDGVTNRMAIVKIIAVGTIAALSFSLEAIPIKWLSEQGVDGPSGASVVLFFDGIYGLVILFIMTACGVGLQTESLLTSFYTVLGGIGTSLALIFVNYGIENGIAGIAFSVANSFPAWHAVVSWLILGQAISIGQSIGIGMAILGGLILSTHDYISNYFSKQDQNEAA